MSLCDLVDQHYGVGEIMASIKTGLQKAGVDLDAVRPVDLAPIDEFHTRGRESSLELTALAGFQPGMEVLDVGCGLGGSARHIASEFGCTVTGIDLTEEYVQVAKELAQLVGLNGQVSFHQGSALDLPFESDSFDLAWTEHAQMNIADKKTFYGEIYRVLKPGGRLIFHDIFQGPGDELHFPVPWAETPSISSLISQDEARAIIEGLGFEVLDWIDKSELSLTWFQSNATRLGDTEQPPLGLHLLMGPTKKTKFENNVRNLAEKRITIAQARVAKR